MINQQASTVGADAAIQGAMHADLNRTGTCPKLKRAHQLFLAARLFLQGARFCGDVLYQFCILAGRLVHLDNRLINQPDTDALFATSQIDCANDVADLPDAGNEVFHCRAGIAHQLAAGFYLFGRVDDQYLEVVVMKQHYVQLALALCALSN